MNDIEKAISTINSSIISGDAGFTEAIETVIKFAEERSEQPTATEFLQKAKAICEIEGIDMEIMFNIIDCIGGMPNALSEADLVRKVMEYQMPEEQ